MVAIHFSTISHASFLILAVWRCLLASKRLSSFPVIFLILGNFWLIFIASILFNYSIKFDSVLLVKKIVYSRSGENLDASSRTHSSGHSVTEIVFNCACTCFFFFVSRRMLCFTERLFLIAPVDPPL